MSKDEILAALRLKIAESFEIEAERVQPEARLIEDLDFDSIDAIDLAVKLQDLTGCRVSEEALRSMRTVADIVSLVEKLLAEKS